MKEIKVPKIKFFNANEFRVSLLFDICMNINNSGYLQIKINFYDTFNFYHCMQLIYPFSRKILRSDILASSSLCLPLVLTYQHGRAITMSVPRRFFTEFGFFDALLEIASNKYCSPNHAYGGIYTCAQDHPFPFSLTGDNNETSE